MDLPKKSGRTPRRRRPAVRPKDGEAAGLVQINAKKPSAIRAARLSFRRMRDRVDPWLCVSDFRTDLPLFFVRLFLETHVCYSYYSIETVPWTQSFFPKKAVRKSFLQIFTPFPGDAT
jgi:hypothetical protein